MYPRFGVVGCHLDDGHTQIASNAERNEETCRDEQTIDFFFSLEAFFCNRITSFSLSALAF